MSRINLTNKILDYLVPERKLGNFFKSKEGGNYNRRNTFKYFEDYNLRLTQILGKLTVFVQALFNGITIRIYLVPERISTHLEISGEYLKKKDMSHGK